MFVGKNFIDGYWTHARPDFMSNNPSNLLSIGVFPQSTGLEIHEALTAAKKAQKSWAAMSRIARGELLDKLCQIIKLNTDRLVNVISEESGKSRNESLAEVNEALHMTQYAFARCRSPIGEMCPSEIADKDSYIVRKPKGVVAVITPWNFPAAISFWCMAPALVEGNTVIWKPSEETPMVAQLVVKMYEEAGFPNGVVNLLHGNGFVGALLVNSDVNHICFTGSVAVGQSIRRACADSMKKSCSLEMGSKSAVIVCEDANIDLAVNACIASSFKLSGQRCVSAGRLIVHEKVIDKFLEQFVARAAALKVGDPLTSDVDMGPIINQDQLTRIESYNQLITTDSRTTVLLQPIRNGNFISPCVAKTKWLPNECRRFLKEEIFGPTVVVVPFKNLDEAIQIYNDTDYGLSVAVITEDYRNMRRVRNECDFGLGYANLPCIGAESALPFGGVKMSGYGGSSAAGSFDAVVNKVTWTVNHSGADFKMAQGLKP